MIASGMTEGLARLSHSLSQPGRPSLESESCQMWHLQIERRKQPEGRREEERKGEREKWLKQKRYSKGKEGWREGSGW